MIRRSLGGVWGSITFDKLTAAPAALPALASALEAMSAVVREV